MPVTDGMKKLIYKGIKDNKRQIDIAADTGLKASVVNYYYRRMKHEYLSICDETYFNVELYRKTTATI